MYKKIKEVDIPKRGRKSEFRFEKTAEWVALKADMDGGIEPKDALQVALTEEDKERYQIKNTRTIERFIKEYIKTNALPYFVKCFRKDDMDFYVVRAETR